VFKTKSGSVLQLNAHQQQQQQSTRQDDEGSDEDEALSLPPPPRAGQSASNAPRTGSVSAAQVYAPPLARSSSFQPRSSDSSNTAGPRLERAASWAVTEADGGGGFKTGVDEEHEEEEQEGGDGSGVMTAAAFEGDEHEHATQQVSETKEEAGAGSAARQDVVPVEAESWTDFLVNYVPAFAHAQVGAMMQW
jgi:hypothetical protein